MSGTRSLRRLQDGSRQDRPGPGKEPVKIDAAYRQFHGTPRFRSRGKQSFTPLSLRFSFGMNPPSLPNMHLDNRSARDGKHCSAGQRPPRLVRQRHAGQQNDLARAATNGERGGVEPIGIGLARAFQQPKARRLDRTRFLLSAVGMGPEPSATRVEDVRRPDRSEPRHRVDKARLDRIGPSVQSGRRRRENRRTLFHCRFHRSGRSAGTWSRPSVDGNPDRRCAQTYACPHSSRTNGCILANVIAPRVARRIWAITSSLRIG